MNVFVQRLAKGVGSYQGRLCRGIGLRLIAKQAGAVVEDVSCMRVEYRGERVALPGLWLLGASARR